MINKVILVGNVGADPEVRSLESGVKVARVRLATSERMYNRDTKESTEHTEWHSITLWRNLADVVDRFVHKGSQIYVEGRLRTREWTDQNGNKRYTTEIQADELKLLGRREGGQQQGGQQQQGGGYQGGGYQGGGYQGGGYGQQQPYGAAESQSPYGQGGYGQPAAAQPSVVTADDPVEDLPF